jgi:hypothetical protein
MLGRLFHRRRTVCVSTDGLHVCACCGASFVCPVDWQALGSGEVWMLLRCGQCQTWREVTAPTRVVERFSADFELAQNQIRAALRDLERRWPADGP